MRRTCESHTESTRTAPSGDLIQDLLASDYTGWPSTLKKTDRSYFRCCRNLISDTAGYLASLRGRLK